MMMINAKEGFWSIKCSCGAYFEISGKKILTIDILTCLNCGLNVDLLNLKEAVRGSFILQDSIVKASKYNDKAWDINPPEVISLKR